MKLPPPSAVAQLTMLWAAKTLRGRKPLSGSHEEFYEEFFTEEDDALYRVDPRMALRSKTVAQALARYVPVTARVLDLGCGVGDVLQSLPDGYELHGVDYSRNNVERAAARLGDRARIERASAYELPFGDAEFGAVICLEVLEHLEHEVRALNEVRRVLESNGVVILSVPYTFYWKSYLALMGHYRHYDRQSVNAVLKASGFELVEYLPNHPLWHQAYTAGYALTRGLHLAAQRAGYAGDVTHFGQELLGAPLLQRVEHALEPIRQLDARRDYSHAATSTFVVARALD